MSFDIFLPDPPATDAIAALFAATLCSSSRTMGTVASTAAAPQMALPAAGFALALGLPALVYRNRRGMA